MRQLIRLLRGRAGLTMVELLVAASLLCLAILLVSMVLSPAAEAVQRLESLNSATVIADNVLEVIRAELSGAQDYVKYYPAGSAIVDADGLASDDAAAIEFKNEEGYIVLISAEGCADTTVQMPNGTTQTFEGVNDGLLLMRYYRPEASRSYTFGPTDAPVARAITVPYSKNFYMGYEIKLGFSGISTSVKHVTVTVEVYRRDRATPTYTDTLVVDLRYEPEFFVGQTARSTPPSGTP